MDSNYSIIWIYREKNNILYMLIMWSFLRYFFYVDLNTSDKFWLFNTLLKVIKSGIPSKSYPAIRF